MQIRRAGERITTYGMGGVTYTAPKAAAAAVPYSLSYDGSDDETDCGAGASIVGLLNYTTDFYWQCPAAMTNGTRYTLVSQGNADDAIVGGGGWAVTVIPTAFPTVVIRHYQGRAGFGAISCQVAIVLTAGNWYYVRARRNDTANNIYISVNAGAEANISWAELTSALNCYHGRLGGATHQHGKGNLCYVHIWNTNKGALAAVPTSPFAVDANTVGRWIHSEGAGVSLGDTSGNLNNGAISGATWSATVPAGWTI